ncbi:MAG: 16S rRNA (cytosine(1402)-N(4))-methyltransferase RsmH [Candidatus Margulisbacteria bacterium]|nr:16S rRNA (cytosine(1402)-N(4))-methyltransferase RsmH [Candidatus Margulisiibacteriota bacterium]
MIEGAYQHTPVMAAEVLDHLNLPSDGIFIDCTLGGGGHVERVKNQNSKVKVYAFDQDDSAISAAKARLAPFSGITIIHDNFANLGRHLTEPVDGILFDLGVSSPQIDRPDRGFSLQHDGPLDMRMDRREPLSAKEIVNNYEPEELTRIFFDYGEERFSRRVANRIADEREKAPIETTFRLKEIVEQAIPSWKKRESVTRIFQALRIAVNSELEKLKTALEAAAARLKPGGRLVVLSYHSLEDRIVKHFIREQHDILKVLTKKPVLASNLEVEANPRARSAKLRAAVKL